MKHEEESRYRLLIRWWIFYVFVSCLLNGDRLKEEEDDEEEEEEEEEEWIRLLLQPTNELIRRVDDEHSTMAAASSVSPRRLTLPFLKMNFQPSAFFMKKERGKKFEKLNFSRLVLVFLKTTKKTHQTKIVVGMELSTKNGWLILLNVKLDWWINFRYLQFNECKQSNLC